MPLVVIEGVDGCGKTTQITKLQDVFKDAEYYREPGGTHFGEQMRSILLDTVTSVCKEAELFCYMASRAQLLHERLKPALDEGKLVILDRFFYSSIAYQVFGLRFSRPGYYLEFMDETTTSMLNQKPDLTVFLELTAQESLKRRAAIVGQNPDRIEQRKLEYFEKVVEGYQFQVGYYNNRNHNINVINAMISIDDIHEKLVSMITPLLNKEVKKC